MTGYVFAVIQLLCKAVPFMHTFKVSNIIILENNMELELGLQLDALAN